MSTPTNFEGNTDLDRKESELVALTEAITSLHAQHTEEGVLRVFKYTLMGQLGIKSFALTRLADDDEEILVAHGVDTSSTDAALMDDVVSEQHSDKRQDDIAGYLAKGRITILERFVAHDLQPTDIRFIKTLTQLCLQSIEKLRLQRIEIEQESVQKELSIARTIQDSLLPNRKGPHEPWDIAWVHQSAKDVGGDLIDIVEDTTNRRLMVMIADGAGKGIPGALLMSSVQALFQYLARQGASVGEITHAMNHQLLTSTPDDTFVTAVFLELSVPSTHDGAFQVQYVNAGHPAGYFIKRGDQGFMQSSMQSSMQSDISLKMLPSTAPLLGVTPWNPSKTEKGTQAVSMSAKDILCWLTDGVLEQEMGGAAPNHEGRVGEIRCGDWLLEALGSSPTHTASQEYLERFLQRFHARVHPIQGDDQTIVMLKSEHSTSG